MQAESGSFQIASDSYENDLKPLIERLQQKIDGYNQVFSNKKAELREYYTTLSQNLTNALGGVSNLNQAVCGAITNELEKCSPVCGGSGCDGKCGTNSSQCSGLIDSYWKVVGISVDPSAFFFQA